jgi:hypothetical protein
MEADQAGDEDSGDSMTIDQGKMMECLLEMESELSLSLVIFGVLSPLQYPSRIKLVTV